MNRSLPIGLSLLALGLSACTTANIGPNAEANQTQALTLSVEPDEAYRKAMQVAAQYGWEVTKSDAGARLFTATAPGTMQRWEDTVTVYVEETEGGSRVVVRSKLGQGPNRRNVEGYLQRLGQ